MCVCVCVCVCVCSDVRLDTKKEAPWSGGLQWVGNGIKNVFVFAAFTMCVSRSRLT